MYRFNYRMHMFPQEFVFIVEDKKKPQMSVVTGYHGVTIKSLQPWKFKVWI